MPIDHVVNFSLEDRNFLKKKANGIHGDLNGLFYQKGDKFYIYVLYGLREKDLISVLAHEIGHAWQAENGPQNASLEDQEGFAQWVAYKALIHFGYPEFAKLLEEGDSVYSKGLNKMLKLEINGGTPAVFKLATGN
jgi:hypothetical protein